MIRGAGLLQFVKEFDTWLGCACAEAALLNRIICPASGELANFTHKAYRGMDLASQDHNDREGGIP